MKHVSRWLMAGLFGVATLAQAQEDTHPVAQTDVSHALTTRVLSRSIAVHLDHVTLENALAAVSTASGVRIVYSSTQVPVGKFVSLESDNITIGAALNRLLAETGLVVVVATEHVIRIEPSTATRHVSLAEFQQGTATISGLVTDSGTGAIITQAVVHVDGTPLTTRTSATGHYTLSGLAGGEYRVTARSVGYLAKTRVVTLTDSGGKTLDFQLNQPATTLNEVVTTALGEERRYQVGSDIATINVDSIAPDAPITSVTDLLAARVPGLEVVQSSGLAGAGPAIRIWGQSSLLLQGDPIVIVDGIRVDNTPGGNNPLAIGNASPSRLNDIDLSSIETINVLKGPSATNEYGTDAANGVIVITTKRGHAGTPTWNASASQSATIIPTTFPSYYWDWGHTADGNAYPTYLPGYFSSPCGLSYQSDQYPATKGVCVVDSITAFNPLNNAATSEYGRGPTDRYYVNVGGGSEQFRYYVGGNVQNQEGVVHTPDVFRSEAAALGYSNSALKPNSENQGMLNANGVIELSSKITVNILGSYTSTYQETPGQGFQAPQNNGPVLDDSAGLYGYGYPYYSSIYCNTCNNSRDDGINPLVFLGQTSSQQTEHWNSGAVINWRPASWLMANLTTGIDHEAQTDGTQELPQSSLLSSEYRDSSSGRLSIEQVRNDTYTFNLQGSATNELFGQLQLVTTFGASYVQTTYQGLSAAAEGLPASAFTLNGPNTGGGFNQTGSSSATEGVYMEEQLNIGRRCSLPLDLRFDAGSAFGTSAGATTYPGWSVSCLVLSGRTTLRVRGAYGGAGIQPPQGSDALQFGSEVAQFGNGAATTAYPFLNPGNPIVKPEYDRDWEGGADLQAWNNRLTVSGTVYDKDAHNLLYTIPLGLSLAGNYTENVGDVRNRGAELTVTVTPFQQRALTATIAFTGNYNHNRLLRLAPGLLSTNAGGAEYFVVGYPLYSYFGDSNSLQYRDQNHDGILEPNDITFGHFYFPPTSYAGSSIPVTEGAAQPSISLFPRGLVRINAVFQYEGGYKVYDTDESSKEGQSANVLGAPLWLQAYNLATATNAYPIAANAFLSGDYLAWNELSVAVAVPAGVARVAHLRNANVVLGINNVALWTPYPFGDPRVSNGVQSGSGIGVISNGVTGVSSANNDIRSTSATVVPLIRAYVLTVNLGL